MYTIDYSKNLNSKKINGLEIFCIVSSMFLSLKKMFFLPSSLLFLLSFPFFFYATPCIITVLFCHILIISPSLGFIVSAYKHVEAQLLGEKQKQNPPKSSLVPAIIMGFLCFAFGSPVFVFCFFLKMLTLALQLFYQSMTEEEWSTHCSESES